jgi:tetratricopeptide (TPR) repeat protein
MVAPVARAQQPPVISGGSSGAYAQPAEIVRSLYDYRIVADVHGELQEFLALNSDLPGSVVPASVSAAAARDSLRSLFGGTQNQAALAALGQSPVARSADALNATAVAFLARGRAAEALACLMLAVDLAPRDPGALVNLAAGALAFHRANEALALLAEAEKLGPPPLAAWGMSGGRVASYLRAYAHTLRGEYPEARKLLIEIVDREPNLREAALTLALVESKLGGDPRKPYLLGVWRHRGKLIVLDPPEPESPAEAKREPDPFTEGNSIAPSMADLFDLSRGKPGTLPRVDRPRSPQDLMAMTAYADAMTEAMTYSAVLHNDVAGQAVAVFHATRAPPVYKLRMSNLYDRANSISASTPELDAAYRERHALRQELDRLTEKVIDRARTDQEPIRERLGQLMSIPGRPTDAEMRSIVAQLNATTQGAIDEVNPVLTAYHHALEREWTLRSSYMHGMLGYIGPPTLRTALIAESESVRLSMHVEQLSAVINLAPAIGEFDTDDQRAPEPGERGQGPECTEEAAKKSFEVDIQVLSIEISCDSVSLEVELGKAEGPLGGGAMSVELGASTSGEVTAFVGPKATAVGVGSVKGGLYVSANTREFTGAGFKSEVKNMTPGGPLKVKYRSDETVVNFVPGPESLPAPGPLPVFTQVGR